MIAGITYVLQRQARRTDSYPAFSSFRTLPEGTSIFYEALRHIPGMAADRNIQPLGAVHFSHAALLFLDLRPISLNGNDQWFSDMDELAAQGNRVIVGLSPHRNRWLTPDNAELNDALKPWGIRLAFVRDTDFRDEEVEQLVAGWPMCFALSSGWKVTRKESGRAVVIERAFGKGSIVLTANPYLFSNAAMIEDRQTNFLIGLIGPVDRTIFDETHFGIEESGSIAALAQRYRLQGLLLGLMLTAALFIWKSVAGYPPPPHVSATSAVTGEDSAAAFLNLLRRNIGRDDILSTCVEEWRKMYRRTAGDSLATAIDLAESGRKTPAKTYAQIQRILGAKPNAVHLSVE